MKNLFTGKMCLIATLLLSLPQARASEIIYHFDTVFPNDPPPSGPAPWVNATFQDGSPGSVFLTIDAVNLTGTEFLGGNNEGGLFFNVNPSINPAGLRFTFVSANVTLGDSVSTGEDAFKANGDGYFDIHVNFSSHNFSNGASITYQITDNNDSNLNANDFGYMSSPGGGEGQYYAAAHVQGLPPNGTNSTWISSTTEVTPAPEPETGALFAAAIALWGALRCQWKKTSGN
jgi:hypothetical protein